MNWKLRQSIMTDKFLNISSKDNYLDMLWAYIRDPTHTYNIFSHLGVVWKYNVSFHGLKFIFTPGADLLGSKLLFGCGGALGFEDLGDYGIFWLLWKRHHGTQKSKNGWGTHIKIRGVLFPPLGKEDRKATTHSFETSVSGKHLQFKETVINYKAYFVLKSVVHFSNFIKCHCSVSKMYVSWTSLMFSGKL